MIAPPQGKSSPFAALFGSSIYSNYFWSILNLALAKGVRFVGILLCIRQMGPAPWGQVAAATVIISLLGLVVDQGLNASPQMFRVHDRAIDRPMLLKITLYRLVMSLAVAASMGVLNAFLPLVDSLVALYALILIPRALNPEWLFHRRERYHLTMAVNTVKAVVFFGLVAWKIGPESPARDVVVIEILAEIAGLLFAAALLRRAGLDGSPAGGRISLRELLLYSFPILLTGALHSLPVSVDVLFIQAMQGYSVLAEYDIGGKIGALYFFLGATLIQIVLPKLSRLHATGNPEQMGIVLNATSNLLLVLGTLLVLPSFYFASELSALIFRKDYPTVVFVFQWIPIWVFASFMAMLNTIVLLSADRRREYLHGAVLSVAVNVVASWFLIRHFSAPGAVFARILSEGVFLVYAWTRIPLEIRRGYSSGLAMQMALLGVLVGVFLLREWLPGRAFCLSLSLGICGWAFWRRKVFSRATLDALQAH